MAQAQLLWAMVDSPWVQLVDPEKYAATVDPIRKFDPSGIFSTHLPPAIDRNDRMFETISAAPTAPTFVGPDQQALESMPAAFEP